MEKLAVLVSILAAVSMLSCGDGNGQPDMGNTDVLSDVPTDVVGPADGLEPGDTVDARTSDSTQDSVITADQVDPTDAIQDTVTCFDISEDAVLAGNYPIESVTLEWFDCPLYDDPGMVNNPVAQCAEAQLPVFWDRACGPTIPVYYKRLLSTADQPLAQLWLLNGGPGASGVSGFPAMMVKMQRDYPVLDLYTIDHRGVGRSARLGCPEQEDPESDYGATISTAEFEACVQYLEARHGDNLQGFRTSFAAIDVAAGISAAREEGKKVFVWGGSYGSYLTQRYLQIFPDQVDGVILEGIAPPDITFATSGEGYETAGRGLLAACMADGYCASKFPGGAEPTLSNLLAKLAGGHCDMLNLTPEVMRYLLTYMNFYYPIHAMIPAAIYRVDRCTISDALAFYNMYKVLFGTDGSIIDTTGSWSMVLNHNVSLSELWNIDQWETEEEMLAYWVDLASHALFGMGGTEVSWERRQRWPTYTDSLYDDGWAETAIPILMLHGELDPATPYDGALRVGRHFDGPHQTFLAFPGVPHNVTSGSPVSHDPTVMHCGQKLFIDFLKNPEAELDTSCMADVFPPDFKGSKALAQYVFDADDYWDAAPVGPAPRMAPLPSDELAVIRASIRADMERDGVASLMDEFGVRLESGIRAAR